MGGVELCQPIAALADVAVADLGEVPRGVQRAVDGHGVGAIDRVGRGDRVRGDRDGVAE